MAAELKPVYLITGADRPKIQRALRRLRSRIGEDAVEMLSASEASAGDAVAACNSMGLLGGGRRLVIVEDVERWKAPDAKTLAKRLEAAVQSGDQSRVEAEHRQLVRWLDRAAAKGALHRNTAARRKAQAARLVSSKS